MAADRVAAALGAVCAGLIALTACTTTNNTPAAPSASPSTMQPSPAPISPIATTTKEAPVHVDARSLWDVVAAVADRMPVSSDTLSQALGTPLNQTDDTGERWAGGQIQLGDSVIITSTELRSAPAGQWHDVGLAILRIGGACQGFDDVKAHYNDLKLSELHPPAPISYTNTQPWGTIDFSFDYDNDDLTCLKDIVFRTR
ncbi:hypothetical protein KL864_33330 [Mycolicibacterium goodii]|uniref:hypothetical protein n=1 Tax=Mycolicibacterium goodii TaxID=134601 RepID=UPI001BDBD5AE|nr:hypothetical protein [Mycolicibacterium goodii]MBU8820754.1 hypothetical protein [Mycolicibacterium goodii]